MPDRMPDRMLNRMSDRISDPMSERMPDRMSDGMSEQMSEIECHIECQIKCQIECQIECQKECRKECHSALSLSVAGLTRTTLMEVHELLDLQPLLSAVRSNLVHLTSWPVSMMPPSKCSCISNGALHHSKRCENSIPIAYLSSPKVSK